MSDALARPATALIADTFDWHALFWTSAALGVVALALVAVPVPEPKVRTGGRFDLPGAIGMAAGLMCLLLGISKGAGRGRGSGTTLGLFAAAVVVLAAWGFFELRVTEPLVDLRVSDRPRVLVTDAASVAIGFAVFSVSLVIPQLLQLPEQTGYGLGKSLLTAGLVMAPSGLVLALGSGAALVGFVVAALIPHQRPAGPAAASAEDSIAGEPAAVSTTKA
ncbi:hypothetical protein [Streptomyces sp. KMM 9044]|uniref:hypothetical protein n=1 Tax=Streptomyces sp. KMM 9044 TaxID=2744474 RepID=UPI0021519BCA|nr:hypothetical protein [Streptomyces sp. KMM 9044]WAX79386.1 hypothetical protein HUV60_018665 [Streptomyces sp. KMM 9044]